MEHDVSNHADQGSGQRHPMTHNSFAEHCREIARRFLLTAVVVDDELSVSADAPVRDEPARPGRRAMGTPRQKWIRPRIRPGPSRSNRSQGHSQQKAWFVAWFRPKKATTTKKHLPRLSLVPIIVILDWRLNRSTGANALPLLARILTDDPRRRLRLIAFYTDEPDLGAIRSKITQVVSTA